MELFTTATTDNKTCIVRLSRILSKIKCVFEYVKGLNLRSLSDQKYPFDVREGFIFMVKALFSHLYIGFALVYPFIYLYVLILSLVHSFLHSLIRPIIHSLIRHSLIFFLHSLILPFIRSFIQFFRSLVHSFNRLLVFVLFCVIASPIITWPVVTSYIRTFKTSVLISIHTDVFCHYHQLFDDQLTLAFLSCVRILIKAGATKTETI